MQKCKNGEPTRNGERTVASITYAAFFFSSFSLNIDDQFFTTSYIIVDENRSKGIDAERGIGGHSLLHAAGIRWKAYGLREGT